MIYPKCCCGAAPIIFTGKDIEDKKIVTVTCPCCNRNSKEKDREIAIYKFNQSVLESRKFEEARRD